MNEDFIKQSKEFWKEIIYKDGKLDEEQILKELSDYYFVMKQVPKVYCHITGGKLSKIFYDAKTIIAEADQHYQNIYEEYFAELEEYNE